MHWGSEFNNAFGRYSPEIAADRLNEYAGAICNISADNGISRCTILLLGDLISGDIHFTTRLENRENAVEQAQDCAEELSWFLYSLSSNFDDINIVDVSGNHSRIGDKDKVLRDERLDNIIPWYLKAKLSHIHNIHFDNDFYDDSMARFTICGKEYYACHGDYDKFDSAGVGRLCLATKKHTRSYFLWTLT